MAQIVINEISQTYTYNIGTNSYATVAMPITSCWGPGYFDASKYYGMSETQCGTTPDAYMLEHTAWQRFPATQGGLEAFVSAYRGPSSIYRQAKDYSYQMAMTLLTAGYDVLVCRMCPGVQADGYFVQNANSKYINSAGDPLDVYEYLDGESVIYVAKNTAGNYISINISDMSKIGNVDASKSAAIDAAIADGSAPMYMGPKLCFKAKYPGTFGNNLQITIKPATYYDASTREKRSYWSAITYAVDVSGIKTAIENKSFVFEEDHATESVLHYSEVESNFWVLTIDGNAVDDPSDVPIDPDAVDNHHIRLAGGTDYDEAGAATAEDFAKMVRPRYDWAGLYNTGNIDDYTLYPELLVTYPEGLIVDSYEADAYKIQYYKEWIYTHLVAFKAIEDVDGKMPPIETYDSVYGLLKDKLSYNPNRIIAPGWDDQDYTMYFEADNIDAIKDYIRGSDECPKRCILPVSPMHCRLMDVSYHSRCATGFLDIPKIVDRAFVHIEDEYDLEREGYTQKLARLIPYDSDDVNGALFASHSALFVPWGQYTYVGMAKMSIANPSFLALMIMRAQILNQAIQYEWALPTNRKHNLRIGKMDYTVPKKLLDRWQKLDGASVNVITQIPDLGVNVWGNSTLFEVPPASYQALANLSTRFLVNAVEDVVYRCGIGITFNYNNNQAYNKFYAGVTPILDTMKNVGAIENYYVKMAADINGLDRINANTVVGKIYLQINGVINDIYVDLIALPPGVDFNQFIQ